MNRELEMRSTVGHKGRAGDSTTGVVSVIVHIGFRVDFPDHNLLSCRHLG